MSKKADIWMPIYIGDYMADTMHLTTEQHGAYLLLLMAYWKNRGPLPESSVQGIVKLNDNAWSNAQALLKTFFDTKKRPGFWVHKRVDDELKRAMDKKSAAVKRAKKAAKSRWCVHKKG